MEKFMLIKEKVDKIKNTYKMYMIIFFKKKKINLI